MAKEECKQYVGELAEQLAKEAGHSEIRVHKWEIWDIADTSELDPNQYTGPSGHLWQLVLEDGRIHQFAKIGFSDREIDASKTEKKQEVVDRLREAISKLGQEIL